MKPGTRAFLHGLLASFGVLMGSAFALLFLANAIVGPDWAWIVGGAAWFGLILVLFEVRGGDLWQWLFPGSPRPRRARAR